MSHSRAVWSEDAGMRCVRDGRGWERAVVRTGHQVGRIRAEGAIPYPPLVALQRLLQLELVVRGDGPDLDGRVRRARRQISDRPQRQQLRLTMIRCATDLTSGLKRRRVRYLLWAWNIVTAWNLGRSDRSSLIFQT